MNLSGINENECHFQTESYLKVTFLLHFFNKCDKTTCLLFENPIFKYSEVFKELGTSCNDHCLFDRVNARNEL